MHLTADQIREYLDSRKGCTFVTLYAVTEPKMRKTANPYFGRVVHIWGENVTFGASYESAVNRQWANNGDSDYFVAESLWRGKGERINPYMARHKETGEEYLVYQLRTRGKTFDEYREATSGQIIDKQELLEFMPKSSPSKAQRIEELGSKEIFPRTVKINGGTLGRYDLGVCQINTGGGFLCQSGFNIPTPPHPQ